MELSQFLIFQNIAIPLWVNDRVWWEPGLGRQHRVIPDYQEEMVFELLRMSLIEEVSLYYDLVSAYILRLHQLAINLKCIGIVIVFRKSERVSQLSFHFHHVAICVKLDTRGIYQTLSDFDSLIQ